MVDEEKDGKTPDNEEQAENEKTEKKNEEDGEKNQIGSDIIRGHINTIILRALYERDKYGYEIMTDIEKKSHGQYTLKQPTLYSALKRLETQGYIKAYWKTDEISSGGRRKYFTLTDSGKEITEKNLSEWEYSRTIIDNLISDKSFDFSQPAPTPVDFKILKESVSRVPVVKTVETYETAGEIKAENGTATTVQTQEQTTEKSSAGAAATEINAEAERRTEPLKTEEEIREDERRKIAHENYMRLISTPVRTDKNESEENVVPDSDRVAADNLLYNNKPETERDYKNLVDGIFNKATRNGAVQASYSASPRSYTETYRERRTPAEERGRSDGVRVSPSTDYDSRANSFAVQTTYDKGVTLFKSSLVVFALTVIEFILSLVFRKGLGVGVGYPIIILALGVTCAAVCGVLALNGYGRNCPKPTTYDYVTKSVIITIIALLIIVITAFLLNVNLTSAGDVCAKLVIPAIVALNIPVFTGCFYLFVKQ